MAYLSFPSPLGDLTLFEENGSLVAVEWGRTEDGGETPLLVEARQQLLDYFAGRRRDFDLPLNPMGTPFQKSVWALMRAIPFGQVDTYGALAERLATSPRPVGTACGRNPLPILIPCHRVVGATGKLGGYSGIDGVETKKFLLSLEGASFTP